MKIDPRVKLFLIAVLTSLAVFAPNVAYLFALLALALLLNAFLDVDVFGSIKRIRYLLALILVIALVESMASGSGIALVYIGKINLLTTGGIDKGVSFALRMMIVIFASMTITTSDAGDITLSLIKLKIPYVFAYLTVITIKFIPEYQNELKTRLSAISMRGIDIKELPLTKKLVLYAYLFQPALMASIIKAEQMASAMESKAFRAHKTRTSVRTLSLTLTDYLLFVLATLYLIVSALSYSNILTPFAG